MKLATFLKHWRARQKKAARLADKKSRHILGLPPAPKTIRRKIIREN
jgi:hypothetical protein